MGDRFSRKYIFTCEHASNYVPEEFGHLFEVDDAKDVLESHRGWDPGALQLAEILSENMGGPLFVYPWTRLLIEVNRSQGHPRLYSEFSQKLTEREKEKLLNNYYHPYRQRVEGAIEKITESGSQAVHVGIHSFVPELNGIKRDFEIGLLYDPSRPSEKDFCREWKQRMKSKMPDMRVRMNQPYKGTSDGFTTALRKKFDEVHYLGIELEVNQKLALDENFVKQNGVVIAQIISEITGSR
ncbi:MAG: N-formylglutamate amidohydrolase [Balneolaceae bacterium]|nr:N-formylglutamate amidohydrolase [Balneolaceae bacterium]